MASHEVTSLDYGYIISERPVSNSGYTDMTSKETARRQACERDLTNDTKSYDMTEKESTPGSTKTKAAEQKDGGRNPDSILPPTDVSLASVCQNCGLKWFTTTHSFK